MKELWLKYKFWFIVVCVLLGIGMLILIYFMILKKGEKKGKGEVEATIPNPSNDAPYTDEEKRQIGTIANRLKEMMSGFGWKYFWSDYSAITDLSNATTRVQIGVYEQYNSDTNGNLITDINALDSLNYDFSLMRTALTKKLNDEVEQ